MNNEFLLINVLDNVVITDLDLYKWLIHDKLEYEINLASILLIISNLKKLSLELVAETDLDCALNRRDVLIPRFLVIYQLPAALITL